MARSSEALEVLLALLLAVVQPSRDDDADQGAPLDDKPDPPEQGAEEACAGHAAAWRGVALSAGEGCMVVDVGGRDRDDVVRVRDIARVGREAQERVGGQLEVGDREACRPLVPLVVVDRELDGKGRG